MSVFARFAPRLQQAIVGRLGWTSLRSVQVLAAEVLLDGHNAVILAPTAGGKTEASVFPVLSLLVSDQPQGIGAVYIAPIKALLNNPSVRAGTDRGAHLLSVIERLAEFSRHDIQRVGLSATVGNPSEIVEWLQGSSSARGLSPRPSPSTCATLALRLSFATARLVCG